MGQFSMTISAVAGSVLGDNQHWHVTQKGDKAYWNKVGAAWKHKDERGYTLQLETCPINGRIVLRLPLEDAPEAANDAGRS